MTIPPVDVDAGAVPGVEVPGNGEGDVTSVAANVQHVSLVEPPRIHVRHSAGPRSMALLLY